MKKVLIPIILIIAIIIFFFLFNQKDKEMTLECSTRTYLVDGESIQKYIFNGINEIVKTQELQVDLEVNTDELVEDYERILKEDKNCSNLKITGKNITYKCNYDLTKEHYYSDLEEDGKLYFKIIKESFESNDFICNYK